MTYLKRTFAPAVLAGVLVASLFVAPRPAAGRGAGYYDLKQVPKPNVTGAEIVAGLEEFVDNFPMRQNGQPNNIAAAEFLAKEAKKYGFSSRILEFEGVGTPPRTVRVVEAIKKGTTKPNEWIAFIAHYDIVEQTIQGAYDDGSGTNMLRFFGKAFSKVPTNRSIALLWFDAEEDGLLASQAYVEYLQKRKQRVAAGLGFDMVGIGYPAPYCICVYHGGDPLAMQLAPPIIDYVNFDHLKFPEGDGGGGVTQTWPIGGEPHVCNCGANPRNSDERNFANAGYFTIRWAGMRTARDYPGYHQPWDTVEFMEQVAGSRQLLEEGTYNTFLSAYYTTFVVDNMRYYGP